MKINVNYPITESIVIKTEAEMRAMGYKRFKGDKLAFEPVNRPTTIRVKQLSRKVQEEFMTTADYQSEILVQCIDQTGMTAEQYQSTNGRAWNE